MIYIAVMYRGALNFILRRNGGVKDGIFAKVRSKELKIVNILTTYNELKSEPNLGCTAGNSSNF